MEITSHLKYIIAKVMDDAYDDLPQEDRNLYYSWEMQSLELVGDLDLFWLN